MRSVATNRPAWGGWRPAVAELQPRGDVETPPLAPSRGVAGGRRSRPSVRRAVFRLSYRALPAASPRCSGSVASPCPRNTAD